MMRRVIVGLFASFLMACSAPEDTPHGPGLPSNDIRSGSTFLKPETRAMQEDEFANPGYLWVDQGRALFEAGDKPCSTCH